MRIFLSRVIFMILYTQSFFCKASVDIHLVSLFPNWLLTNFSPNCKCFTLGSRAFILLRL